MAEIFIAGNVPSSKNGKRWTGKYLIHSKTVMNYIKKTKQIKDFLINSGVKDFSDDSKAMNEAIGKSLMITFISEEYIGINKDNEEPVIRTATKYRWSAKSGGKCTYNHDMNQTLNDEQMAEFSKKHSEWSKANSSVSASSDDEDMPF